MTFSNTEPGRGAQALQGLAVDGRKVSALDVSLWVKGSQPPRRPAPSRSRSLAITFYDENRSQAGYTWVGPWRDSFAWQQGQRPSCACPRRPAKPSCASA